MAAAMVDNEATLANKIQETRGNKQQLAKLAFELVGLADDDAIEPTPAAFHATCDGVRGQFAALAARVIGGKVPIPLQWITFMEEVIDSFDPRKSGQLPTDEQICDMIMTMDFDRTYAGVRAAREIMHVPPTGGLVVELGERLYNLARAHKDDTDTCLGNRLYITSRALVGMAMNPDIDPDNPDEE